MSKLPSSHQWLFLVISLLIVSFISIITTRSQAQAQSGIDFTIDIEAQSHDISPYIYGVNYHPNSIYVSGIPSHVLEEMNLQFRRLGGNRSTGGNWENNASYSGTDLFPPQTDWYSCLAHGLNHDAPECDIPAFNAQQFLTTYPNVSADYYSINTIPMTGWVAAERYPEVSSDLDNSNYDPSVHFNQVIFDKQGSLQFPPDLTDGVVYTEEHIDHLINTYGSSITGGFRGYALDNEPGLWASKHPHLRTPSGQSALIGDEYANSAPVTVNELLTKSTELADVIKNLDPNAEIFGPVLYGWQAYIDLQTAADYGTLCPNDDWFIRCYLREMQNRKPAGATYDRLVDVLDIHWYPELYVNNVRVVSHGGGAGSADLQTARMQAPRALYDPDYPTYLANNGTAESYIVAAYGEEFLPLLPKLTQTTTNTDPGVKLAVTEFSPGGESHISGGIATADLLGAFGRENIYAAAFWLTEDWSDLYIPAAYKLYRNYDGNNATFGSSSLAVTTTDQPDANEILNSSVYASLDDNGNVHIIILNKNQTESLTGNIDLGNATSLYTTNEVVWGFDQTSADIRTNTGATISETGANTFSYSVPPYSAHHLVLTDTNNPLPTATPTATPTITPTPSSDCAVNGFDPANMQSYFGNVQSWNGASNGLEIANNEGVFQEVNRTFELGETYTLKGVYQTDDPDASFKLRIKDSNGIVIQQLIKDQYSGLGAATTIQPFELTLVVNAAGMLGSRIEAEMWNGGPSDPLFVGDLQLLGPCEIPPTPTPTPIPPTATPTPSSASIAGQVWDDIDGDGIRDPFEGDVANPVRIHLWRDSAGQNEYITSQLETGSFVFPNLNVNETYSIQVSELATNFVFSPVDQGGDDTLDSDIYGNGYTDPISLNGGGVVDPQNVGVGVYDSTLNGTASLSGQVWQDSNDNGQIDAGEPFAVGYDVLAFIDVNCITDPYYDEVFATVTDSNGAYNFEDLHADNCYVIQVYDSNGQSQAFESTQTPLAIGVNTFNVAIDEVIENTYRCDVDGFDPEGMARFFGSPNGVTQSGGTYTFNEDGLGIEQFVAITGQAGITYTLKGEYEAPVGADYTFTLALRDNGSQVAYTTEFATQQFPPTGNYEPFEVNVVVPTSGADQVHPIIWHSSGSTGLAVRELALEYICNTPPPAVSIAGQVWEDSNEDGVRDGSEGDLSDTVTVTLWTDDGSGGIVSQVAQITTSGSYSFPDLDATQAYQVQFGLPNGYAFSPINQTSDDLDSDADVFNGYTGSIAVDGSGNFDLAHVDAGMYVPDTTGTASISGQVWEDTDEDGFVDGGEPLATSSKYSVLLFEDVDCDGWATDNPYVTAVGTNPVDATYSFANLNQSCYTLQVFYEGNSGFEMQYETAPQPLISGENEINLDLPAVIVPTGSVSGQVWEDTNQNGIRDGQEGNISSPITVTLWVGNPLDYVTQQTTSGAYSFTGLDEAQDYSVSFHIEGLTSYQFTSKDQGGDDTVDSDVYVVNGYTDPFKPDGSSGIDPAHVDAGVTTGGGSSGNATIEIANSSGVAGYSIGIFGSGFGSVTGTVTILNTTAQVDEWTDTFIRATVPDVADDTDFIKVTTTSNDVASWDFEVYSIDEAFLGEIKPTFQNLFTGKTTNLSSQPVSSGCFHVETGASVPATEFLTNFNCGGEAAWADFDVQSDAVQISVDVGKVLPEGSEYYFQFYSGSDWYMNSISAAKAYEIQVAEELSGPWISVHSEANNLRNNRLLPITIPTDPNSDKQYRWVRMEVTDTTDDDPTGGLTFRILAIRLYEAVDSGEKPDTIAIFGDSITANNFKYADTQRGFVGNLKAYRGTANDPVFSVFGLSGASAAGNLADNPNEDKDIYDAFGLDNNREEIRYWGIGLGTNDLGFSTQFYQNVNPVIEDLITTGEVPILARMPDINNGNGSLQEIREILIQTDQLAADHQLIPGPDFYTEFRLNIENEGGSYFGDPIHHSPDGALRMLELWAQAFADIPDSSSPPTGNDPTIEIANISGVSSYEVGIFGSNFGQVTNTVTILDTPAEIVEWTDTFVRVIVPDVPQEGLGELKLTHADGAFVTSEFTVYSIAQEWLDTPQTTYTNISYGKPLTLTGVNVAESECPAIGGGTLDANEYLTAYECDYGIAAKFKADSSQSLTATITIDFEQPLAAGEYMFQWFSLATWSAGDRCGDTTGYPTDYTIQVSSDGSVWSLPLVDEQGNLRGNRSHELDIPVGTQWLRMQVTNGIDDCYPRYPDGTVGDGDKDFQLKEIRLYQVNSGNNSSTDSIAIYGDSITAGAFNTHVGATNLNALVDGFPSNIPFGPYGFVGRKAEGMFYDGFDKPDLLEDVFTGDDIANSAAYWGIALGTNDQNLQDENDQGFSDPNSQFNQYDVHIRAAIEYLRGEGRVPILARFPDTDASSTTGGFGFLAAKKVLLNEIDRLNAEYGLIPGPDLYTEFRLNIERENDSWLSDFDGTHLDGEGHRVWVQMWADALSKGFTYRNP